MNCYLHPETVATAFCRSCGRPLCTVCQRTADGTVYCQDHVPVAAYAGATDPNAAAANPYLQPAPVAGTRVQTSPGLAFVLGLFIPGVGAIYNGQYVKGLVHAVIFGLLISLISSNDHEAAAPFLGLMISAFVFYMAFEAYHTAKKRQMGIPVEEWSSLAGSGRFGSRAPIGPILLILIGVLFLLDTLHLVEFREVGRFWPVLLIVVGAYMLYGRVSGGASAPPASQSFANTGRPANGAVESPHE